RVHEPLGTNVAFRRRSPQAHFHKHKAQNQRAEKVARPGKTCHRRKQADGNEERSRQKYFAKRSLALMIKHRNHADSRATVILPVYPRDGVEMRELPKK